MLQSLYKILALILAVIVLFSSFSFTIEKHICLDEVTVSSHGNTDSHCEMDFGDCESNKSDEPSDECCFDNQVLIIGNQNVKIISQKIEVSQAKFVLAYAYTYLNLFQDKKEINSFLDFSPPIVDKDYQVLYQSFLI